MSLESTLTAAGDLVSCALDDEAILLNVRTGTYYGLDAVGYRIWQLLEERPRTVRSIRDAVLDEFDVGVEQCSRDVLSLLAELERHRLVEVMGVGDR